MMATPEFLYIGGPQWQAAFPGLPEDELLDLAREFLHTSRHELRLAQETGGFTNMVGEQAYRIDSDRDSLLRITNAATSALTATLLNAPWATVWACADGQSLPLDASGMLVMHASLVRHGQLCHTRSQELRAEIEASQDFATIEEIAQTIHSGWPL
jgi:hypothetical protein